MQTKSSSSYEHTCNKFTDPSISKLYYMRSLGLEDKHPKAKGETHFCYLYIIIEQSIGCLIYQCLSNIRRYVSMLNVGQIDRQSLWPLNNNAWLFSVSSDECYHQWSDERR